MTPEQERELEDIKDIANKILARIESIGNDAMTMTIGEKEEDKS